MKTPKEFYEMHHHIDVGVETKEGCIKMMEAYVEYAQQQVKKPDIENNICDKCGCRTYSIICCENNNCVNREWI